MWLVVVGVLLMGLKLAGLGPVAGWSWWWVLAPFAGAALWWQLADSAGWTQRAAAQREQRRVQRRREARLDALGMRPPKSHFGGETSSFKSEAAAPGPANADPAPPRRD